MSEYPVGSIHFGPVYKRGETPPPSASAIERLQQAFEKARREAPEPDILILHPGQVEDARRLQHYVLLANNQSLWEAFLAGYKARRMGEIKEWRAKGAFEAWCWETATKEPPP